MVYHPEDREEILAKRADKELKSRTYRRNTVSEKTTATIPAPLAKRLDEYRKIKEKMRSRPTFIDEFLDSEVNQKKYGFTTKIVNGIREIYYDGDLDQLNDAMYGPRDVGRESDDSAKMIHLSEVEGQLYARLPHSSDEIAVKVKIDDEEAKLPRFSIVTDTGAILTQLCLTEPAYYPDESSCRYLIDMRGLSVLNKHVRNNFGNMIDDWNRLHPTQVLDHDIPLPNYRFLASYAYTQMKKNTIVN